MSVSKRGKERQSLLEALGTILDHPTAPQPVDLLDQIKSPYLLLQLHRKLGPCDTILLDSPKPVSDSPFSHGLYLDSPCPVRLYLKQWFSLFFHVIDRSGTSTSDLNSQSFSISLLTPQRTSHRKGLRTSERVLGGTTTVQGNRSEGIAFHLRFTAPVGLNTGGKVVLQVQCCTDQRIMPLELPEIEVISHMEAVVAK